MACPMLQCNWCGEVYLDDEAPDRIEAGFWCDLCEGFTFFDPSEQSKHRLLLLLEEDLTHKEQPHPSPSLPRLRKQLSPLRYPGGKSKLIDYLYTKLSAEKLDTFVEVFAGGASLGLSLLDAGIINHLVLNDKDPGVYALWKTIIDNPQELVSRFQSVVPTHRDLVVAKEALSQRDTPQAVLAWSFLLANRLSYSGIIKANPLGGKNGTQEALLARWNSKKLEDRILHIHSLRDKIEIHNEDACQFLQNYGYWNPHSTCFIDPPYYVQGSKLYNCFYSEKDHEDLAELIQSLYMEFPEADLIITYDNHPRIRELYRYAKLEVIQRKYSL